MLKEIETGEITLIKDDNNPIYILNGNISFYETEYKIMKNFPELLHCFKGTLNGKTELLYLTESLKPLSTLIPQMSQEAFVGTASKILATIKRIEDNGFLDVSHIDADNIFLKNTSVYLVYLPISGSMQKNNVVEAVAKLSEKLPNPNTQELINFRKEASTASLTELISYLEYFKKSPVNTKKVLTLFDAKNSYKIVVNKSPFVLGKKTTSVDAVISYSRFVGRVHCQIINENNKYIVYDLNSTNGTAVNGVSASKGLELRNGDTLQVADVAFTVSFEEAR